MKNAIDETEWCGSPAAATRLGMSQRAVYRLIDQGALPAYKLGRVVRIRPSDIEHFLSQ